MSARTTTLLTWAAKGATPAAVLLSGAIVWQASTAAFSVTTANATNNWATGNVSLTDDDAATAMFNATGLMPGATGSKCIVVTYSSPDTGADVRLYGTGSGTLSSYLTLTIEKGTGGSFNDCTGFASTATIFTGDLAAWNLQTDFSTGVGNHPVTAGAAQNITYRVNYAISSDTNSAGKSGAAGFTWEAKTP